MPLQISTSDKGYNFMKMEIKTFNWLLGTNVRLTGWRVCESWLVMRVKIGFTSFNQSKTIEILVVCTDGSHMLDNCCKLSCKLHHCFVVFFLILLLPSRRPLRGNVPRLCQRVWACQHQSNYKDPTCCLHLCMGLAERGGSWPCVSWTQPRPWLRRASLWEALREGDDRRENVWIDPIGRHPLSGGYSPFSNVNGRGGC